MAIPAIFRRVNSSCISKNEKKAVKTGIRLEKMLDLLMPINLTEWAKKTNAAEEARTASRRKDVMMLPEIGTVKA